MEKILNYSCKCSVLIDLMGLEDATFRGSGFLFGSSLNFGISKGFKFSVNLDYLAAKFDEVEIYGVTVDTDGDDSFNNFSIGFGVRYNF